MAAGTWAGRGSEAETARVTESPTGISIFFSAENRRFREEFRRTDRDGCRRRRGRRQLIRHFLQDGEPYRDFHFLFRREEQGQGCHPLVAEHGEETPELRFQGIRQGFDQQGAPPGQAEAHLFRQEIVFAGIRRDLQQHETGEHGEITEVQQQHGAETAHDAGGTELAEGRD